MIKNARTINKLIIIIIVSISIILFGESLKLAFMTL